MYFGIVSEDFAFLMVTICINGFFTLSIFAIMYELGVECTYPVGEAMSGGLINSGMNLSGLLLVCALTPILNGSEESDVLISISTFIAIQLISLILLSFAPLEYKRRIMDRKLSEALSEEIDIMAESDEHKFESRHINVLYGDS
jgi:ABC-type uncharacterized transport system permease subunit